MHSKASLRRRVLLMLLLAALTVGLGLAVAFAISVKLEQGRFKDTVDQLSRFSKLVYRQALWQGRLPNNWEDATEFATKADPYSLKHLPLIRSGRDAWDNRWIFERKDDGQVVVVRSAGPDGIDDGGGGDDIVQEVDLSRFLPPAPTTDPAGESHVISP